MPGWDEETVRREREDGTMVNTNRERAERTDQGASPDAGTGENLGIGPAAPQEDGAAGDQTYEDLLEDR